MSVACTLAYGLWRMSCRSDDRRFARSLGDCACTQEALLHRLLRRNRSSEFGREHGFDSILSVGDYRRRVPVSEYSDYTSRIDSIAEGRSNVLTCDGVELFQPTSGSSSGRKLIPYSRSLRDDFRRAIAPWVSALSRQYPGVHDGPAYWSVSPLAGRSERYGRVRVGFDTDWSYLGALGRLLYSQIAVRPALPAHASETDGFVRNTLSALLSCEDLRFVSIWSPSFLTVLLEAYRESPESVLRTLSRNPRRVSALRSIGVANGAFEKIWPQLRVISCWTHASSEREAKSLQEYFPTVPIQPKGLLSTEAVVSIPLLTDRDPVLASMSHFFEFETPNGDLRSSWEVQSRKTYSVVVTTSGGLYRYRTHDTVEVTGFVGTTPCLRFLGRDNLSSDLRGEKLESMHVTRCIESVLEPGNARFAMLAPSTAGSDPCYVLFLEDSEPPAHDLALCLESELLENPHYRWCRELGQLGRCRVFHVVCHASRDYTNRLVGLGATRGDVKASSLSNLDGWEDVFDGDFVVGLDEVVA
jgi:hypothetical protein